MIPGKEFFRGYWRDHAHPGPYDTIGTPRPKPFARDQYEIELDEVRAAMRRSRQHLAMYERPR